MHIAPDSHNTAFFSPPFTFCSCKPSTISIKFLKKNKILIWWTDDNTGELYLNKLLCFGQVRFQVWGARGETILSKEGDKPRARVCMDDSEKLQEVYQTLEKHTFLKLSQVIKNVMYLTSNPKMQV